MRHILYNKVLTDMRRVMFIKLYFIAYNNNIRDTMLFLTDTDKDQNTKCIVEKAEYTNDAHRPLWFVYSGMGSQWTAMGAQLMRIPIFAAAVER